MTATNTATASPCTRAGCSRPAAGTFSMTDTQPMKTKNMVPTISARHGWNSFSYLLGGLGAGDFLPFSMSVQSVSSISIFSTPIFALLWAIPVGLWLLFQGVVHKLLSSSEMLPLACLRILQHLDLTKSADQVEGTARCRSYLYLPPAADTPWAEIASKVIKKKSSLTQCQKSWGQGRCEGVLKGTFRIRGQ